MAIVSNDRGKINCESARRRLPPTITKFRENAFPAWLRKRIRATFPDELRDVPAAAATTWALHKYGPGWLDHFGTGVFRDREAFISRPRSLTGPGIFQLWIFAAALGLDFEIEPAGSGENLHLIVALMEGRP